MKCYLSICFLALCVASMSAHVAEGITEKAEIVQVAGEIENAEKSGKAGKTEIAEKSVNLEKADSAENAVIAENAGIADKAGNAENAEQAVIAEKSDIKSVESAQQSPMGALYGFCNRRAIIEAQPEYAVLVEQMETLKKQYEGEIEYNEADFRRQFQEYLYGQKEFPQTILLKRQRDLQLAMEKGIAFRAEVDSLLRQARTDLLRPIEAHVDAAINAVAAERGYDYVVDTENGAFLYLNPRLSEDITLYVEEKLR